MNAHSVLEIVLSLNQDSFWWGPMGHSTFKSIALLGALGLSACGGTSQPPSPNFAAASSGIMSGQELDRNFGDITDYINETLDVPFEPVTAARVTVNGLIYTQLATQQNQINAARLTLNADFANSTLSGQVGDYAVYQPSASTGYEIVETLGGSLAISNTSLNGMDMRADLTGTLIGSSGVNTVDAQMSGDFISINGVIEVDGPVTGTVTNADVGTVAITNGTFFAYE